MTIRVGVLTVSDRSFLGKRVDTSGPALVDQLNIIGWSVLLTQIVPDEMSDIQYVLIEWSERGDIDVILTTGGTGFAPRDITPEATLAILQRLAPGLAELMRLSSLKVTPHAMLSRGVAGIRNRTIIVNLPGSPKAAVENLKFILPIIPHAVDLLQEIPSSEIGH